MGTLVRYAGAVISPGDRPYRQNSPLPERVPGDDRRWVASKDADPRIRLSFGADSVQNFVEHNPGWSAIADDDPRWLPFRPGLNK